MLLLLSFPFLSDISVPFLCSSARLIKALLVLPEGFKYFLNMFVLLFPPLPQREHLQHGGVGL